MLCNQKYFYKSIPYIIMTAVVIILASALCGCGNQSNVQKSLSKIDQNPSNYVQPNQSLGITAQQQAALAQDYIQHYFSPWDPEQGNEKATGNVLNQLQSVFSSYKKKPGWGINYNPLSVDFVQSLQDNANLSSFPNINQPGIIIHRAYVRGMPTTLPSFGNPKQAGEGFPFDNLQESYVGQGMPVRVLHQSKDKLWYVITTSSFSGWVPSREVGLVSPDFIRQWKNNFYVITQKDNVPLSTNNSQLAPSGMRVGLLYPAIPDPNNNQQYIILAPMLMADGSAQISQMYVDKNAAQPFPLPISPANVAAVAHNFIGTPYGWGGLYDQRDCSATTQDLFATFGIWLPRNSGMQSSRGEVISIAGLSPAQKLKIIEQRGIPFLTLIQLPGHVVLYIGMRNNVPYVLQDVWGLKTKNLLGKQGRIVVGKTVITPVNFGSNYLNVINFLNRAQNVIILKPEKMLDSSK